MKRFFKILAVLFLAIIFVGLPLAAAQAASPFVPLQETAPNPLDGLFATFATLTGVAMFVPALVSALKKIGLVKDGTADIWTMVLNILAFVALAVAQLTGYSDLVPVFDAQAGMLANVINVVIGYIYQLFASRMTYQHVLAGLPLIGKSFSGRKAGEGVIAELTTIGDVSSGKTFKSAAEWAKINGLK